MAVSIITDFKIYQEEFNGGVQETVAQNLAVFNSASMNTIRLVDEFNRGQYAKESFFKKTSAVTRRDVTSSAGATAIKLEQGELVEVKVHRKFGPIQAQLEPFIMTGGEDAMREMSFLLGRDYAEQKLEDQVNTAVLAGVSAIGGQANLINDYTATGTINHAQLAITLGKMGDRASAIKMWVMHSKNYFDLIGQSITDKITNVADVTIYNGTAATLGRPVVVTDDPALLISGTPDTYNVLGLVENAIVAKDENKDRYTADLKTGSENLFIEQQGEYGYSLGVKGFAWDIANGGANPDDTAIALSTNWDKAVTADKDLAGVLLQVQ